jgi:hypothetical protein
MAAPTSAQLGAVRTLIETAPQSALRSLGAALANAHDGPMAAIRAMVETEQRERGFRDAVFAPLTPLFSAKPGALGGPRFPCRVSTLLWAELKAEQKLLVSEARRAFDDWQFDEKPIPRAFDDLCACAARLLREKPQSYFRGDDAAGAGEQLAAFFDLAGVARKVIERLPEWLGKATDERVAQLKLLFKDATAVAVDATPRMLELVLAHLPEPQAILRLVSIITDRANDRYLAASELKTFGDRLLDDADARIAGIKAFDAQGGAKSAAAAAESVTLVCAVLAEIESAVDLSRDGPWGARVTAARKALAFSVESRLRDVDGAVNQALPLQNVRIAGRMTRPAPKIAAEPDEKLVERARALCLLLENTRAAGAAGGYGALRNAVAEKLTERLNVYADEVLHAINSGEAPDEERALRYLEIAAEFLGYAEGPKAAQIVRRRAAVAGGRAASQDVA